MSKPRLNVREILQANPELSQLAEGEQVNVNHVGCEAGRDTKKRLYVKRAEGSLLMYCHHCQGGGRQGGKRSYIKRDRSLNVVDYNVKLPADLVFAADQCHVAGNVWLGPITMEERLRHNIGWSEREGRVILPVYDGNLLVAYQRRRVLKDDQLPKYLTTRRGDTKHPYWHGHNHDRSMLVLTEDILSAICVNRLTSSISLLGTYMSDELAYPLSQLYSHIIVWLDDDNPAVRTHQRKIVRRLQVFCPKVSLVRKTDEPKHMTDEQIKKVLDNL